jgi:hypothetical protein
VQPDHPLQEDRLGAGDVLDGLAGHRIGDESDEIAGMSRLERNADLAVSLEAADARSMPGARIDDDERAAGRVGRDALWRDDAHEAVIDRPLELAAVHHELEGEVEHVRDGLGQMRTVLVAALAHHVPVQDAALCRVDRVLHGRRKRADSRGIRRMGSMRVGGHGNCSLFAVARRERRSGMRCAVSPSTASRRRRPAFRRGSRRSAL